MILLKTKFYLQLVKKGIMWSCISQNLTSYKSISFRFLIGLLFDIPLDASTNFVASYTFADAKFALEHAVIKTFLVYIHVVATQFGLLG